MKTKGRWTPNEQRVECPGIGQIMIRDVEGRTRYSNVLAAY